jgi:hypothetical protein
MALGEISSEKRNGVGRRNPQKSVQVHTQIGLSHGAQTGVRTASENGIDQRPVNPQKTAQVPSEIGVLKPNILAAG